MISPIRSSGRKVTDMKKYKKIFLIFSLIFIFLLIIIMNRWISSQINKIKENSSLQQKTFVQPEIKKTVTKAVPPVIDPQNDPLAPRAALSKPEKKFKPVKKYSPQKKYELSSDNDFLIQ